MRHEADYFGDRGDGYGGYTLSDISGLLTFCYLKLFCCKAGELEKLHSIKTIDELIELEKDNCLIDQFIHNERVGVRLN